MNPPKKTLSLTQQCDAMDNCEHCRIWAAAEGRPKGWTCEEIMRSLPLDQPLDDRIPFTPATVTHG